VCRWQGIRVSGGFWLMWLAYDKGSGCCVFGVKAVGLWVWGLRFR